MAMQLLMLVCDWGLTLVDITGETPWVKQLCDRYHDKAAFNGTRIIPSCGFDCVPSDLGTYLVVRYMQRELGVSCLAVKAYFQLNGGFNGGTLASGFNLYDDSKTEQLGNPFLLNPSSDYSSIEMERNRDPQFPQYDADIDTWVAPFFMGAINTRVVRRSRALYSQWQESYGSDFTNPRISEVRSTSSPAWGSRYHGWNGSVYKCNAATANP